MFLCWYQLYNWLNNTENVKKATNCNNELDLSKICRVAYFEEVFDIIERFHNGATGHAAARNTSYQIL